MQRRLYESTRLPRLLLTGFGPFPGIPLNASSALVEEIARRLATRSTEVVLETAMLPTEWKAAPAQLQAAIRRFGPDVALHFGVASEATGFRIETTAENFRARMPDAAGHVPRRRQISAIAPSHLLSTFPAEAIQRRLGDLGIKVELSTDAGRYLCNATLFRSLSLTARSKGAPVAGFIHIPAALADAGQARTLQDFDWPRAIEGGLAIVETCLAHALVAQATAQRTWPAGITI